MQWASLCLKVKLDLAADIPQPHYTSKDYQYQEVSLVPVFCTSKSSSDNKL